MSKIEVKETKQFNGQNIVRVHFNLPDKSSCAYCMFTNFDFNLCEYVGSKITPCALEFPSARPNCEPGNAWIPETYLPKLQEKMNANTSN